MWMKSTILHLVRTMTKLKGTCSHNYGGPGYHRLYDNFETFEDISPKGEWY